MRMPKFVWEYLIRNRLDPSCLPHELCESEWEMVHESFVSEDKYNNVNEQIWRHVPTGRFARFYIHSLPYGITDYGMMPGGEDDIDEVFPVRVAVTQYLTIAELASPPVTAP